MRQVRAYSIFGATSFSPNSRTGTCLQGPERLIFDKDGAPVADIRGPYTATLNVAHRKALPVRQFGEKRLK